MNAPTLKEIPMRELWVVGRLKTGEVLTVQKLLAPKQGHPQFKNQMASRRSFEANEKLRAKNGAWFTQTIFKTVEEVTALGVNLSNYSLPVSKDTQQLFYMLGYTSKTKRYESSCMTTKLEDPKHRALFEPETSDNS